MTAKELIALLEKAVILLEENNKKLDKEVRERYKRKYNVIKNNKGSV